MAHFRGPRARYGRPFPARARRSALDPHSKMKTPRGRATEKAVKQLSAPNPAKSILQAKKRIFDFAQPSHMSEYEIFYSTADAELECGWYWHARCVGPALETVWI